MEKDLLHVDENYIYARIIEALTDSLLAIELFERGLSRNSAGKAFSAVKALISALVVKYNEKLLQLAKDDKEKEWIKKKAHIVPTHSMKGISNHLAKIGIDVKYMVNLAYDLHEHQYNGFEPGFSPYNSKDEVKEDIITVINLVLKTIKENFEADEEIVKLEEKVKEELDKFQKNEE